MGDMAEYFNAMKKHNKEVRQKKNEKYYTKFLELGAIEKSDGVLFYNGWFLYPTKGFTMNSVKNKKRMSLDKFIDKYMQVEAIKGVG